MAQHNPNPIFHATRKYILSIDQENREQFIEDKFYFWNEVWSDAYGPYNTRAEAEFYLKEYCEKELGIGKES